MKPMSTGLYNYCCYERTKEEVERCLYSHILTGGGSLEEGCLEGQPNVSLTWQIVVHHPFPADTQPFPFNSNCSLP